MHVQHTIENKFDSRIRFLSLRLFLQHSKKAKIAIMSNARPPNVPPTTGPRETLVLEWDWEPLTAPAVEDESVADDEAKDEADVDVVASEGTIKK